MDVRVKNIVVTIGILAAVSIVTFAASAYFFMGPAGEPTVTMQRDIAAKLDPNASFDKMGPGASRAAEAMNKSLAYEQFNSDVRGDQIDRIVQINSGKDVADLVHEQMEAKRDAQEEQARLDE